MIAATAIVDPSVRCGVDVAIWHFCHIMAGVVLGDHVSIGTLAEIGRGTTIGTHSRIGYGVFLPSNSRIGERVFVGPSVTFTDDRYPEVNNPLYRAEPPTLEDDCSIGAGAVILPGVRIGQGARVGAGAIVTADVAAFSLVRGESAVARALRRSRRRVMTP